MKQARRLRGGQNKNLYVIGFPNGYSNQPLTVFETEDAVNNGAMKLIWSSYRLGKGRQMGCPLEELKAVRAACRPVPEGHREACLLTESEKIRMCGIVSDSGADYIKTSTGFSTGGATREDVALFRRHIAPHIKIKAAGGIRTLADAEDFIRLGADRLGTSAIVKLVKNEHSQGY